MTTTIRTLRSRLIACAVLPACTGLASAHTLAMNAPGTLEAPIFVPVDSPAHSPARSASFKVDLAAISAQLAKAPLYRDGAPFASYALHVRLPAPDGALVECLLAEAPIMHPELQARFPEIRSYAVETADGAAVGRLNLTSAGVTAMLRSTAGTWMIDPSPAPPAPPTRPAPPIAADRKEPALATAAWLSDVVPADAFAEWTCHTVEGVHGTAARADAGAFSAPRTDRGPGGGAGTQAHRTVRLAVACSGEYGAHQAALLGHAPNVADALAAIVTSVSRANVVYEGDFGISFQLVANNDQIVFIDPATDPYPDACDGTGGADCSSPYLSTNITALNNIIGFANYDVGHVLTRVYGGVAYISSVCSNAKGGGVSGIPRGGDVNDLTFLVLIHEMGHQFGCSHTFSGARGRCANNVTLSSAWEAGSGSSPMAYAGGCPVGNAPPSDNVVLFADPYFHHGSFNQVSDFIAGMPCAAPTTTANVKPVFTSISPSTFIPPSTPFALTAAATDPDSPNLTYSWEQFDSGVSRPLSGPGSEDNGSGCLFRIFPPTSSPTRTFPRMSDVLSGMPTPGERLPTATGFVRTFRCIVRDNAPIAGASVVSGFTNLTIAFNASPFGVNLPAANSQLAPGSVSVTWSVGSTNAAPISCSSIAISLSTNGGATFGAPIATVPNTGSATVNLPPNIPNARLRLASVGNVFFNVSPPFAVLPCPGDFNLDSVVSSQDIFAFLNAWFSSSPTADIDNSGTISVQDIFVFLQRWFARCP